MFLMFCNDVYIFAVMQCFFQINGIDFIVIFCCENLDSSQELACIGILALFISRCVVFSYCCAWKYPLIQ